MDPVEDAKDAKEYNAQHMSIEERKREWQIEKDLFGPMALSWSYRAKVILASCTKQ